MKKVKSGEKGTKAALLYLEVNQLEQLLGSIMQDYGGKVVYKFNFGKSTEGRPLDAYTFMLGTDAAEAEKEMKKRPSVFINAVHHARELTTISQVAYTMIALLHGYEHGNEEYAELMRNAAIIFVPMINPDGVAMIDDLYRNQS